MKLTVTEMQSPIDAAEDFRRAALVVMLLFSVAALAWHTGTEFRYGVRLLAGIQLGLAVHFVVLLHVVRRRPYSKWLALAFLAPLLTLILIAMAHGDTPLKVFIWVFLIPVLSYALLERKLGFVASLVGTLLALLAYLFKYADTPERLHILDVSDSLMCLFGIWIAMHLYERNRERTTRELQRLATTDQLTGLHNRRQLEHIFTRLAGAADRHHHALAVVVMDLDHFKQINDRWGHHAGDAVLVHVAKLLRDHLRAGDWAFRIGGEEFCLFLPMADGAGATSAADALRRRIAERPCELDGQTIPLSASIGVSMYPTSGRAFEQLLSLADERMYRAKQQGRNRVIGDDAGTEPIGATTLTA
ncbi:MAG TPA: GGDEF domain-containing protein [Thiobacillaceae bacterium]